jgi:hypothetical protein
MTVHVGVDYWERDQDALGPLEAGVSSEPLQDLRNDNRNDTKVLFLQKSMVEPLHVRALDSIEEVRPGV